MSKIKVKPEYAEMPFGFNGSGAPLGHRDDLHLLLANAKYHQIKEVLDMFEDVPDEEELKEIKADTIQEKKGRGKKKDSNDQTDEIQQAIANAETGDNKNNG